MIAIDTNILVYAHREDSPWHDKAYEVISDLAQSRLSWALPWPCLHEFLAIVTHPRIYNPPTPVKIAVEQIEAWLESPGLSLLSEINGYWTELRTVVENGRVSGPQIHDARIAALCKLHGVRELWTADRDFTRFPGIVVRNPLIG
ncbi:MAG: type II toxin-antitoxin system VapC family toxin [Blastocatellales bacterium]